MGAGALLLGGAGFYWSRGGRASAGEPSGLSLQVPRAAAPIHIDAELEGKKVWEAEAGGTGNLKDQAGKGIVPYTDVKVRWDSGMLYLRLYAGDLDLEGTQKERDADLHGDDSFHIEVGAPGQVRAFDVSVLGTLADAICRERSQGLDDRADHHCDRGWQSHAQVAVDTDGSLNHIHDNDEEWVVEMAIPFEDLGISPAPGAHIPFSVSRCEIGADGKHACGGWGTDERGPGQLVLEP